MKATKQIKITDFHTHCLPGIDDGAADMTEALAMLTQTLEQGIDTVVASPHFYPREQGLEDFLGKRDEALAALRAAVAASPLLAGKMRILAGAEVLVQEGVGCLPLQTLCLEGTDRVMLELPFSPPPMWLYEELERVIFGCRTQVIFAHVDRYRPWYRREQMAELLDMPGAWAQINGVSLQGRRDVAHLAKWIPEQVPVVLGSDMHHAENRGQNLERARRILGGSRYGREWLQSAARRSERL